MTVKKSFRLFFESFRDIHLVRRVMVIELTGAYLRWHDTGRLGCT